MALDEDRLEDWVELFDEDCDYRIVTRENVEQGLPNVLMWCDNKNMLRDRVESYRNVNLYNPHYDRHVIGPFTLYGQERLDLLLRGRLQPVPDQSRGRVAALQRRALPRRGECRRESCQIEKRHRHRRHRPGTPRCSRRRFELSQTRVRLRPCDVGRDNAGRIRRSDETFENRDRKYLRGIWRARSAGQHDVLRDQRGQGQRC